MKKFILLLRDELETLQQLSPKEIENLVQSHMEWAQKLEEKKFLISGDGLEEKGVLIQGKDCIIKDGPYIESKEMIGGYYLLQAETLEEIIEIAKECPCHLWGGTTEIRPIMDYDA
ncbi:YciI family protein [Aquimarina hainanensis]|uniref:YciI family protein n=1 Tax=Aquimarina hainanensis TaxID=1578017 RepID=A0ABW5N9Q5_9FLAO|nr:YciI family protein [Aquimarina sp. TRL1]QKX07133.1 hypothetical protein HN014_20175 [Aquimarina sp. TRL1]